MPGAPVRTAARTGPSRLGARLQAARHRAFVGRHRELDLFRSALAGDEGAPSVLYLHGPGGVGKSMLLRRFAEEAERAGRTVVELDGRILTPSPDAFEAEARAALGPEPAVLLVDTFERCQGLEVWLRERFLPRLRQGALVVLAGRAGPDPHWLTDLGWTDALRVVALHDLEPREASALLAAREVPSRVRGDVLEFAGGHPLALSLASAVASRHHGASGRWYPPRNVIEALLSQVLGDVPSPAHREALELCAHASTTTESLLRAVLPHEPEPLFAWLRQLPFVECGRHGLYPHDVVRETLEADLRWRDPQGYALMHRRLRTHLCTRVRTGPEHEALAHMGALSHLYCDDGGLSGNARSRAEGEGEVYEEQFRAQDRDTVLRLAFRALGRESGALVRHWLDRRPEAFRMYRRSDTGALGGFLCWLRLTGADEEHLTADPVARAAWAWARGRAPLREGEHLGLARFAVTEPPHDRVTPVVDLFQSRILLEMFRAPRLAWSVVVTVDNGFWDGIMERRGMRSADVRPQVAGRRFALFAHDWRAVPMELWLDARDQQLLTRAWAPPRSPELAVLSRSEFDAAVRDALRSLGTVDRLAESRLLRTRLAATRHEPVPALRELLTGAIEGLRHRPRGDRLHRAVATTFLNGPLTQEAAAERTGMPFSSYRRHLGNGIDSLCEALWQREIQGTPDACDGPDAAWPSGPGPRR